VSEETSRSREKGLWILLTCQSEIKGSRTPTTVRKCASGGLGTNYDASGICNKRRGRPGEPKAGHPGTTGRNGLGWVGGPHSLCLLRHSSLNQAMI
jgi:hypothetical protein